MHWSKLGACSGLSSLYLRRAGKVGVPLEQAVMTSEVPSNGLTLHELHTRRRLMNGAINERGDQSEAINARALR